VLLQLRFFCVFTGAAAGHFAQLEQNAKSADGDEEYESQSRSHHEMQNDDKLLLAASCVAVLLVVVVLLAVAYCAVSKRRASGHVMVDVNEEEAEEAEMAEQHMDTQQQQHFADGDENEETNMITIRQEC
jgi:flagellar biosynthesis/type III secretory pathway M-ring protein FliF/YscJ